MEKIYIISSIIIDFLHLKDMKKLIFIFAFLLINLPQKSSAVNIGGLSVTVSFCQNIQKLGSILNSYTQVQWPTTGAVGVTVGVLQNESAVMVMCDYIIQLQNMDTTQAIFYSASTLNKLTDNKWKEHLDQADRTWNIANTLYDFENGESRKGTLESASTHRELDEYIKDSRQWASKTFNGKDADVRTRMQRENDMNAFSQAAYQRAIIKEMISCPEPTDNKNYANIYKNKIKPLEGPRDIAQEDYMFFKERLLEMGPRFMGNETDLKAYVELVEKMENNGVGYKISDTTISETTTKNSKTAKDTNGKPVKEKSTISRPIQVFEARLNDTVFSSFKEKYSEAWKSFVNGKIISNGIDGLLNDPVAKFQKEFVNLNYECSERKIMSGYDINKQDYYLEYDKRRAECEAQVIVDQKKAESLISYYTDKLKESLYSFKSKNAQIWTTESKELKRTRVVTTASQGSFTQEQVSCAQDLTPAEMDKLMLKQQSVNNDFTEMLAKETMKQNIREEEEAKQLKALNKEYSIMLEMVDRKAEERRREQNTALPMTAPKTGLGIKK